MRINNHHHFGNGNLYGNVWGIYNKNNVKIIDYFDGWSTDCWDYIREKYGIDNVGKIVLCPIEESYYYNEIVHY